MLTSARRSRMRVVTRHKRVARSLRFLRANWRKPINVRDLVKVAGLSRRGFDKAFRKHVGTPPGTLLRRIRLRYATRLITSSNHNLMVVSKKCGYRHNSFMVAFKRETGLTPRCFRRRMARRRT